MPIFRSALIIVEWREYVRVITVSDSCLYSLRKIIIAPSGHIVLLLILNIDLFPFLWGNGNLIVITKPV